MSKQQTREELLKVNAKLEQQVKDMRDFQVDQLREFARAFGWTKKDRFGGEEEPVSPTWAQVFIHVGELLNRSRRNTQDVQMREMREKMEVHENQFRRLFNHCMQNLKKDAPMPPDMLLDEVINGKPYEKGPY